MIRVLVSENTPGAADQIAHRLATADDIQVVGYARDGLEAAQMVAQMRPDVALIHIGLTGMDGFQACQMATMAASETGCVLLVPAGGDNHETWQRALRCGARGVLPEEVGTDQLLTTVREVGTAKACKQQREYQLITDPAKMPVTITVTGAKGGIGKTTIATNLAICLQQQFPGEVVLVDFVGQYGDVPLLLDMQPAGGLGELLLLDEIEADMVQAQLAQHSSGLRVLAAPNGEDMGRIAARIAVPHVATLVSILRSKYRFIVFDAPPLVGTVSSYLFSRCNFVVLVTYLVDLAAIRDTGRLIESLVELRMPSERIKLVVNRSGPRNAFTMGDLQKAVKHKIDAEIPEDGPAVTGAINEGVPIVLKSPGSPVARAIKSLCQDLVAGLPQRS